MATRRMISTEILFNDNFVSLSSASQSLYVYVLPNTDEYGFCDNVKSFIACCHAKQKDLKALIDAKYILELKPGVYLVKHFPMFNKFREDRMKPCRYGDLLKMVEKGDDNIYHLIDRQMTDRCQADDRLSNLSNISNLTKERELNTADGIKSAMRWGVSQ